MTADARPRSDVFIQDAGGYIDAMRRYRGLSYRRFAQAVRQSVRGKRRQGSENYLYRLCTGQTALRPELIDGIARALELRDDERRFLQQSLEAAGEARFRERGKALLRLLKTASADDPEQVEAFRALVDPLVIAVYALAGGRRAVGRGVRAVAQAALGRKVSARQVRAALQTLREAGLLHDGAADALSAPVAPGTDIAAQVSDRMAGGAKSEAMKLYFAALDEWGARALQQVPREERNFQSITFLSDRRRLQALNRRLDELWREQKAALRAAFEDAEGDVVVHVGLRAWPMLELDDSPGGPDDAGNP